MTISQSINGLHAEKWNCTQQHTHFFFINRLSELCVLLPQWVLAYVATGGVVLDNLTRKQTPSSLRKVLAPKLDGAVNAVGALAAARPSRGVAYFSSIAALLGNAGQANYSAANAALDALAASQQSLVRMPDLCQVL